MHKFELPDAIEQYASELEKLGARCSSTEGIATDAINFLYNQFGDVDGERNCALMRFFRTMPYSDLLPYLQQKVQDSLGYEPPASTTCLTLLATRGIEPAWNDRLASVNHQVIPLVSTQIIQQAPMVAQLIQRLGIDASCVVEPSPTLFLTPEQKHYDVMYVPEARMQKQVFAQPGFVEPFGVRSVIGFGTLLPTGDMFAVLMFMRVYVQEQTAQRCQLLAQALELAINNLRSGKKGAARILVAAGDEAIARLSRLLDVHHTLIFAPTVERAISQLEGGNIDLIICGTTFDDSRMFDLLTQFKKERRERTKPFICFRQMPPSLGERIETGVTAAAEALGATCFIDAVNMNDSDLLQALQAYLPERIWNETN